jgi:hypothetical protein
MSYVESWETALHSPILNAYTEDIKKNISVWANFSDVK